MVVRAATAVATVAAWEAATVTAAAGSAAAGSAAAVTAKDSVVGSAVANWEAAATGVVD